MPGVFGSGAPNASQLLAQNPMGAAAIRGMANSAGAQGAGNMGLMSSIGGFLKDGKNLKALGDTAIGGMNAVNANRQQRMEREEMERRRRMEDEQLERQRGMDPMRAQLLAQIMQRLGGGSMGQQGYEAGTRVGV
jgi:hypothetical protein